MRSEEEVRERPEAAVGWVEEMGVDARRIVRVQQREGRWHSVVCGGGEEEEREVWEVAAGDPDGMHACLRVHGAWRELWDAKNLLWEWGSWEWGREVVGKGEVVDAEQALDVARAVDLAEQGQWFLPMWVVQSRGGERAGRGVKEASERMLEMFSQVEERGRAGLRSPEGREGLAAALSGGGVERGEETGILLWAHGAREWRTRAVLTAWGEEGWQEGARWYLEAPVGVVEALREEHGEVFVVGRLSPAEVEVALGVWSEEGALSDGVAAADAARRIVAGG